MCIHVMNRVQLEKRKNSDARYNMEKPSRPYAKCSKPDTKGVTEIPTMGKFMETESRIEISEG